jgi:hypothetical protein
MRDVTLRADIRGVNPALVASLFRRQQVARIAGDAAEFFEEELANVLYARHESVEVGSRPDIGRIAGDQRWRVIVEHEGTASAAMERPDQSDLLPGSETFRGQR